MWNHYMIVLWPYDEDDDDEDGHENDGSDEDNNYQHEK